MHTFGTIIPLIGGLAIGAGNVFRRKPEFILSYRPFVNNDAHLVEYYKDVPYILLDEGGRHTCTVDMMCATPPCAGLSSLSPSAAFDNPMNEWMYESARYSLGQVQPRVFFGENSPHLASKMGEPVLNKLREIGEEHGYTMTLFVTRSILHGLSQIRNRAFYFFWKEEDRVPVFEYYDRPHERIEDVIMNTPSSTDDPMSQVLTNDKKPTDNPFYRFVLEEVEGGISHQEFSKKIERTTSPMDYLEKAGYTYDRVHDWMVERGHDAAAARAKRSFTKLKSGGNIMRKTTEIVKDYIGAFVGHYPTSTAHPVEDRHLTIREALEIMKMPRDFMLLGGRKNLNHICQNVPVSTAEDMARNVLMYLDGRIEMMADAKFMVQDNKTRSIKTLVSTRVKDAASLSEFF